MSAMTALLAACAALLFGLAVVVSKIGLRHVPPLAGASISIPATAAMMWLVSPFLVAWAEARSPAVLVFAAIGLVFPAMVTWLTFTATDRIGPTITNAVGSTAPMFAILLAVIFLGEHVTGLRALGVGQIVVGIAILSWQGAGLRQHWAVWLLALPIVAAAIRGAAVTLGKYGLALWPAPFAAALVGYTVSAIVVLALGSASRSAIGRERRRRAAPWFAVVGLLNGGAVLVMYMALAGGEVAIVSSIVATSPLFTMALSAMLLREERINVRIIAGVTIVLAGVVSLLC